MKMKGIILNSEMVNTILDKGVLEYRKAIKVQPTNNTQKFATNEDGRRHCFLNFKKTSDSTKYFKNPIGYKGDKLFVKESFNKCRGRVHYVPTAFTKEFLKYHPWKPATNMRQDQSRLTLEITDIKVEKADVWEWVVNLKLIK